MLYNTFFFFLIIAVGLVGFGYWQCHIHVYAQRQISIWLLLGQTRTTCYISEENDRKRFFFPDSS